MILLLTLSQCHYSKIYKKQSLRPLVCGFFFFFLNSGLSYIYYRRRAKSDFVNNSWTVFRGGINIPLGVTHTVLVLNTLLITSNVLFLLKLTELFQQFPKS